MTQKFTLDITCQAIRYGVNTSHVRLYGMVLMLYDDVTLSYSTPLICYVHVTLVLDPQLNISRVHFHKKIYKNIKFNTFFGVFR